LMSPVMMRIETKFMVISLVGVSFRSSR